MGSHPTQSTFSLGLGLLPSVRLRPDLCRWLRGGAGLDRDPISEVRPAHLLTLPCTPPGRLSVRTPQLMCICAPRFLPCYLPSPGLPAAGPAALPHGGPVRRVRVHDEPQRCAGQGCAACSDGAHGPRGTPRRCNCWLAALRALGSLNGQHGGGRSGPAPTPLTSPRFDPAPRQVGLPFSRNCNACHKELTLQMAAVSFVPRGPPAGRSGGAAGSAAGRARRREGGGGGTGGRSVLQVGPCSCSVAAFGFWQGRGCAWMVEARAAMHASGLARSPDLINDMQPSFLCAFPQVGQPLPGLGTCKHYRHSYRWLRFPCCGKHRPVTCTCKGLAAGRLLPAESPEIPGSVGKKRKEDLRPSPGMREGVTHR
jgi:hypothetical protein